jgi:hypothetical protein
MVWRIHHHFLSCSGCQSTEQSSVTYMTPTPFMNISEYPVKDTCCSAFAQFTMARLHTIKGL